MDEMFQLTIWDDPMAPVQTAAGGITFGKWIAEQAAGLASAGIRAEIRKRDSDHFIALFRSRGRLTRRIRCLKENAAGQGAAKPYPAPAGSASLVAQPPRDVSELYHELLYAVERCFPGESRHETALRYIRETERRVSEVGSCKPNAEAHGRRNKDA